ncbi:transposase/IS protein [Enterococcus faecalis]|nr:transposase/IS protein [Enterococcus faecalis]OFA14584.1 transposase/IS protein [Enterococcus faecalis]
MSNYYQLLNKLEDLNLKHTREILPEYLDTIVQENISFVEALNHLMTEEINARSERQKENRLRKANLPLKKTINDFDFGF